MSSYWLTPPELYSSLDREFNFDFDPCPCPRPEGYNSLLVPWGRSNYVNPPFRRHDGVDNCGPTAFVHKAIAEQRNGNGSVLLLPCQSYVMLLAAAGAEIRSAGRVRFLEKETGEPWRSPSPCCLFILRGNAPQNEAERSHTASNTGSPKLPTLAECVANLYRDTANGKVELTACAVAENIYGYICRQLRAGA